MAAHKKNKQRPDIILKCTNRDKLHREYKGVAAPTTKSSNTPDSLRGKKRISHKRNFKNTPFRNMVQAVGKKINDFSKSGFENRPTERSMQSTRTHYTNVTGVNGKRGQQYNFNQNGLRYTRKQDLIANRPGGDVTGKAGPTNFKQGGRVYNPKEVARKTIRETTEDNRHHGFVGSHQYKGPSYDENEVARKTVRETTEDNRHRGFVGSHQHRGKSYNLNEVARKTIRETTEDNRRHGNLGNHQFKGPVYDENEVARKTIRETTENNNHQGHLQANQYRGKVYNQDEVARKTIRETTEDNRHQGHLQANQYKGPVYDQNEVARKTVRETTENNHHHGFVGSHQHKGKAYNQNEVARKTIRETTENNKYIAGVSSSQLQNGDGYRVTRVEAKNPQKAYLCNNEYIGAGEATSNKKPRTYESEYQVNTNKEKIAVGRAPNEVKNPVQAGKESVNICVNKLDLDREVPHLIGKGTNLGNIYNPNSVTPCSITKRKNVPFTQVDRLQAETLDAFKNNPLQINQNLN